MDMFTWWPPQDLHLPSPSICREANLLSLVVLGVSALVAVWGVATPLKFVHSFHTLLTFAPFTMVGFLRHSWLPLRFL